MSGKVFNLTLVRHGQTTHNKLKIIQGQMDTQLTDLGREQAKLLCNYLEKTNTKFDKVYSSDLTRAFETCQLVCNGKYEITANKLIRERSFGVLQGSSLDMLRSEAYKAGHNENNFTLFRPEGGETVDDLQDRIQTFCKTELLPNAKSSSKILIVTHGGVVREFMRLFKKFGCAMNNSDMVITPNTSMNNFELHVTPTNLLGKVVTISLHQIPHLTAEAKYEALSEEQLNDGSTKKKDEVEYAV